MFSPSWPSVRKSGWGLHTTVSCASLSSVCPVSLHQVPSGQRPQPLYPQISEGLGVHLVQVSPIIFQKWKIKNSHSSAHLQGWGRGFHILNIKLSNYFCFSVGKIRNFSHSSKFFSLLILGGKRASLISRDGCLRFYPCDLPLVSKSIYRHYLWLCWCKTRTTERKNDFILDIHTVLPLRLCRKLFQPKIFYPFIN